MSSRGGQRFRKVGYIAEHWKATAEDDTADDIVQEPLAAGRRLD